MTGSRSSLQVERAPAAEILSEFIDVWGFPNGRFDPEHVEALGPTGSGKSYSMIRLLHARCQRYGSHAVIIATKPADKTLTELGWPVISSWPPDYGKNQVIYWKKAPGVGREAIAKQREAIRELLNNLWRKDANIVIYVDELVYLTDELGLKHEVVRYLREARAMGITLMLSTQRAQGVTRYMHSETTWKIVFAPTDFDDALRLAEVLGDRKAYTDVLMSLDPLKHEFLLKHARSRQAYITHL